MISIQGLGVTFGSQTLLADISFVINRKERIALVGKNGAGKSTLLKIIAGEQSPSSGVVARQQDITIGYLPQQMPLSDDTTVLQEAAKAFSHIMELDNRITQLNAALQSRTDYDSEEYGLLIDRLTVATEQRTMMQSDNANAAIERTLIGLGFERSDFDRPTSEFSGGWRMRVEIAKLLLQQPDVLLLDEPTNHLDIESIQWLENFLKTNGSALMLVSHDRAFLDNVTTRTIELSLGHAYDYQTNYSHYVALRAERLEQQRRAYENQQREIQDAEQFIERFRYKATKAVQVQSRIKQLAKIERIAIDEVDNSHLRLRFQSAPRSGDYPIIADEVAKSYGDLQVFSHVTFTLKRGEKVAFVGKNGAGKSTLVKCIMGQIPFEGTLSLGHNVSIGYFAQNQAQLLDESLTVFETVDREAVGDIRTRLNDILGAFMFGGAASDKRVKVLSGGERSRLAMIKLLLQPINLLILDEPTNHLDMRTKDILKNALKAFDGTLIVVSHDRDFLDGLVDKVFEFGNKRVREHLGGIYDFLQSKQLSTLRELERNDNHKVAPVQNEPTEGKLNYLEQKERERTVRQARKAVTTLEEKIAKLEAEIAEIEEALSLGNNDSTIYVRHSQAQQALELALVEWEQAGERLNELTE